MVNFQTLLSTATCAITHRLLAAEAEDEDEDEDEEWPCSVCGVDDEVGRCRLTLL